MENRSKYLLVVDNNEASRAIAIQRLEQIGYTAAEAKDGKQAFEILSTKTLPGAPKVDLVMFDSKTAKAEEFQTIQRLKSDAALRQIPVMVTSAVDDAENFAAGIASGAEDYFVETSHLVLLKTRIAACIAKTELSRQLLLRQGLSEKLERDLEIGRKIQTDFLPDQDKIPRIAGWEIAARLHPARMVAGDFFDAFLIGRNKIGMFIGDVCDKGVGPAMFMALIRSLLRAFSEQHRPLGWMDELISAADSSDEIRDAKMKRQRLLMSSGASALLSVELTNHYISENHGDMYMFATLFFGVLDPATGLLTYVNAGQDPAVIVGADGVIKAQLAPTGPIVGIIPNAYYGIEQVTLAPGDFMIVYTDGVPDACDPNGEQFTEERLFPLLRQPFSSVNELLDRIDATLHTFIGDADQFDDITMLAIQRKSV